MRKDYKRVGSAGNWYQCNFCRKNWSDISKIFVSPVNQLVKRSLERTLSKQVDSTTFFLSGAQPFAASVVAGQTELRPSVLCIPQNRPRERVSKRSSAGGSPVCTVNFYRLFPPRRQSFRRLLERRAMFTVASGIVGADSVNSRRRLK